MGILRKAKEWGSPLVEQAVCTLRLFAGVAGGAGGGLNFNLA
jgi:hypothetical protein